MTDTRHTATAIADMLAGVKTIERIDSITGRDTAEMLVSADLGDPVDTGDVFEIRISRISRAELIARWPSAARELGVEE